MSLLSALAQYSLVHSRIEALLQTDDDSRSADLSFLLRQARDLRKRVLDIQPADSEEAVQKLACIVSLIQRDAQLQGYDRELSGLLEAAQATCEAISLPSTARASLPPPAPRPAASVFGGSVADYVAFAAGRVSLIDTCYRVVATSEETARHFGRQQIALMGRPLAELMGPYRFHIRAKGRLDACFAGEPQCYHLAMPSDLGRAQILRCDMKPVATGEGGILGALVYMTDVTEQVRRLRPDQDLMICRQQSV